MFYIFNISFYVNPLFEEKWSAWLENCFDNSFLPSNATKPEVFEIISETPSDSIIFSVQWKCASLEALSELDESMSQLLHQLPLLFGEEVTHFSSVLKQII